MVKTEFIEFSMPSVICMFHLRLSVDMSKLEFSLSSPMFPFDMFFVIDPCGVATSRVAMAISVGD